jgi:hypothetical protein
MAKQLTILKEGKAEAAAGKWFSLTADVHRHQNRLRESQKALAALEQEFPWLGGIKGILRKKDGEAISIPEGGRRVPPTKEATPETASGSKEETPLSRPEKPVTRKRKVAPLLEKSRRG